MKGKTCERKQMKENTKREGAQDESNQARGPRSEEKWMPKRGKVMRPKVGNNSETRRPGAYKIHLYSWRGDRVGYGAASTKIGSEHKGF